jgi:nicotinate-nucleotide adenylyltransferase
MQNDRVAIFGGTFNPIHAGHVQCVQALLEKMSMDNVFVVPAAQNPLKIITDGPTPEERLEMVKLSFKDFSENVLVDESEINRGGKSYSIDTVKKYALEYQPQQLHVVIGIDELYQFDKWKSFQEILTISNLIVINRPGATFPISKDELPSGIQPLVEIFDKGFVSLTTGRHIEFLRMKENLSSSTEIRRLLRTGRSSPAHLNISVEEYIRSKSLYTSLAPRIGDYKKFTEFCSQIMFDRKAINVKGFDLTGLGKASEFTLISSGTSNRHTQAIGEVIMKEVKNEFNVLPLSIEGMQEGRWVLLDYGNLIVHVFYDFLRNEHNLEGLWRNGVDLNLIDSKVPATQPK